MFIILTTHTHTHKKTKQQVGSYTPNAVVKLLPHATVSELDDCAVMSPGGASQTNMNLANHRCCTKLLANWQWHGRPRCGLGLLRNMPSFCSQSALTPAYRVCWDIQPLVPPLGNLLTLKSLTFRTSFSVFHCLLALSISRTGEAITKTISRDRRKLIKLMLRKCTFLPPRSHLIGQFVEQHLVTIQREQHILVQWLRQYFVKTTACTV